MIGMTRNRQAWFEPCNSLSKNASVSKDPYEAVSDISCTTWRIDSTGFPMTLVLSIPENMENALLACTMQNGGVDSAISLNKK